MARRLIWSNRTQQDLKSIFDYWNHHNVSNEYSKKLTIWIDNAAELLVNFSNLERKRIKPMLD